MNDTARLHPEIAAFAAAVRERLADLDAEEIEELTGDLEADLQERLEETGTDLGDPDSYAAELRAAAGLPSPEGRDHEPWYEGLRATIERRGARLDERLRSNETASAALDFAVALRPVWWVLRAWVAYQLAHLFFAWNNNEGVLPDSPYVWVLLLVATVVSVQWGRGRWRDNRWVPAVSAVGSVIAVLGAPIAIHHAEASAFAASPINTRPVAYDRDNGLRMNGRPVRNVFAYDAKGNPLRGVQLFSERGEPLSLKRGLRSGWRTVGIPATLRTGNDAWNVYPLVRVPRRDTVRAPDGRGRVPKPDVVVDRPEPPMPHAPVVMPTPEADAEGDTSDDGRDGSGQQDAGSDREPGGDDSGPSGSGEDRKNVDDIENAEPPPASPGTTSPNAAQEQ